MMRVFIAAEAKLPLKSPMWYPPHAIPATASTAAGSAIPAGRRGIMTTGKTTQDRANYAMNPQLSATQWQARAHGPRPISYHVHKENGGPQPPFETG
jgi:hypothetical protein